MNITPRRLLVNGVHLGVIDRQPDTSAHATLVLLHGFTGSAAGWGAHSDAFVAAGLRVVALDMLGHGAADAPDDPARYRIERCQEDIEGALAALGIAAGEADLLGYSMGARIALYTALSGGFRRLILESGAPGIADPAERAARRASDDALADRIETEGVPAFVDFWQHLPLFASQRTLPDAVQSDLRAQRLHNTPRGLANSLRGVGTGQQPALHDQLASLTLPTLLIAGALDAKYTSINQQMAAAMPNATLRVIPDAGHTVHLEQPQIFDDLVIQFLVVPPPNPRPSEAGAGEPST